MRGLKLCPALVATMTWGTLSLACMSTAAYAAEPVERDANVFGYQLHYREAGQGPVVILLHGLGGDGSRWTATIETLAADHRVIAVDQIGFGKSDKPLVNYNNALLAEFLAEFMRVIKVPKATLVGHSMGGFVSQYLAVHRPEIVERMVLVDGGGFTNRPRSEHLVQIQNGTTLAETREYFELMFYDKGRVTDEMVRDNYRRRLQVAFTITKMQEARAKNLGLVSAEEAATIVAPTLIVWGAEDVLLEPAIAGELHRAIPGSRVEILKECGHLPQVEQAVAFNKLVREFLLERTAKR